MGDFKPLGSEKLNANEKLKRILELTYYNNNKDKSTKNSELIKESKTGGVFGIVKEKDGYYVKRGLNEQSLDYIGGLFMKNKNRFSSYAEALKRLELLKGQEQLQEATKYVLKQNKPKEEAPMPEPSLDAPPPSDGGSAMPSDIPPPSGDDVPPPSDMPSPEGDATPSPDGATSDAPAETKRSDYMAEVQKYAGKLGQELRDQKEKMESDDIKYVLNMIISAVDLDKLELEDLEEVSKKFEREEDKEAGIGDDESANEPAPEEEPAPEGEPAPEEEPAKETEMSEYDYPMSKLEEFIESPLDIEEADNFDEEMDFSKYSHDEVDEDIVELDLDEIKSQINKSVGDTLSKYFK